MVDLLLNIRGLATKPENKVDPNIFWYLHLYLNFDEFINGLPRVNKFYYDRFK